MVNKLSGLGGYKRPHCFMSSEGSLTIKYACKEIDPRYEKRTYVYDPNDPLTKLWNTLENEYGKDGIEYAVSLGENENIDKQELLDYLLLNIIPEDYEYTGS